MVSSLSSIFFLTQERFRCSRDSFAALAPLAALKCKRPKKAKIRSYFGLSGSVFLVSSRTKRSLVIRKRPLVGDFCLSFEGPVTDHRRAVSDQIILTKTVRSRGPSNSHR